ncbi:hypothetical protein JG688_00016617 [Phytophthora aleatoria]|uniref:DOT1 domain-containing protein n=1 Tax=Phytophthora aleatoria TaxID=2496075 RepID=A0A8J5I424_9STRA|nr:hypothetical protein JG688_00016617 [Phytophthora aleatoria]
MAKPAATWSAAGFPTTPRLSAQGSRVIAVPLPSPVPQPRSNSPEEPLIHTLDTAESPQVTTPESQHDKTVSFGPLSLSEVAGVISTIFGDVSARDVRQQVGRIHGNAGEVLPTGVADLINAMGPVNASDVFLDIGSGIGVCIGVEVRAELSKLSEQRSQEHLETFPHLCTLRVVSLDVRDASLSSRSPLCEAILVFANNFLFEERANLVLARELCEMRRVRVVATSRLFCPRHRAT